MKTSKRRPVGRPAIFVLAILCAFALFASPALASRAMAETPTPSPSATTTPTPSPSATTTATPANDKATSTATPTQTASAKATPANSKAASEAAEKADEAAKADAAKKKADEAAKADAAKKKADEAAKADAAKADAAKKKAEADAKASATPEATKVAKAITPPTTGGWTPFSGNAYKDGEISPFYVFINVPANPAGSSISFMVEDSKLSVVSVDAGAWDNDGSGRQIGDCSRVGGSNEISCRFYPSDVDRATQASFGAMVRVGVQKLQKVSFSIAGVSESIWISPADQPTTSKPDPVIAYGDWVDVPNGSDCEAGTVGQTRTVTTTDWIARLGEWVKDEPVVTTESQTRPMTVAELADCQPPVTPEPTPEPTPPATATPEPSGSPSATPPATATPEPSGSPSATQEPTATSGLNPGVDQGPGADDSPLGSIGVALSIVGLCGILVTVASFFNRRKKA